MAYASLSHARLAPGLSLPSHGPPRWMTSPRALQTRIRASPSEGAAVAGQEEDGRKENKRCLRCGRLYSDADNSPTACSFHGHITGERGLFSLAPPHQGIDGEWSDRSGVIVYRWNEEGSRPNTGRDNWKKQWSCCQESEEDAPPCRRGWHVSYDDGFTRF